MIELRDVCKRYGDKVLFDRFSMRIKDGAFLVITGESGCGKTTLLNMIGGLDKPDGGSICIDGRDIHDKKNTREFLRTRIGFLFQNFALVEGKTVEENLSLVTGKARSGVSNEAALRAVKLSDKAGEKVYKLSGGEQQRIAIARLMVKKCDILLADEPTGSLDEKNSIAVMELLKKLNQEGKTVIVVTHDTSLVGYADSHIHLGGAVASLC